MRGDDAGSEVADLTGVLRVWFDGDADDGVLVAERSGEDGRVGVLD